VGDYHNSSEFGFDPKCTGAAPVSPARMKNSFHLVFYSFYFFHTFGRVRINCHILKKYFKLSLFKEVLNMNNSAKWRKYSKE
jgi:hypothetical protein